jgi:hypothetical protein
VNRTSRTNPTSSISKSICREQTPWGIKLGTASLSFGRSTSFVIVSHYSFIRASALAKLALAKCADRHFPDKKKPGRQGGVSCVPDMKKGPGHEGGVFACPGYGWCRGRPDCLPLGAVVLPHTYARLCDRRQAYGK